MFFYLAKILWFFLQPSSLMLLALIAGALLAGTAWRRLSRWLLFGGVAAIVVCGLLPVGDLLIRPLEDRFPRPTLEGEGGSIAGIIVLGGSEELGLEDREVLASLNGAAERYIEAVVLVAAVRQSARGVRGRFSHGRGKSPAGGRDSAAGLFEALGVERERVTLESTSRDTYENAMFSARLVQPRPEQRWLLVTSASHMPRAMGCFRRAGFNVVAWPVDYHTPRRLSFSGFNRSIPEGLSNLDGIAHEYVGLLMYYVTGRINSPFPAP